MSPGSTCTESAGLDGAAGHGLGREARLGGDVDLPRLDGHRVGGHRLVVGDERRLAGADHAERPHHLALGAHRVVVGEELGLADLLEDLGVGLLELPLEVGGRLVHERDLDGVARLGQHVLLVAVLVELVGHRRGRRLERHREREGLQRRVAGRAVDHDQRRRTGRGAGERQHLLAAGVLLAQQLELRRAADHLPGVPAGVGRVGDGDEEVVAGAHLGGLRRVLLTGVHVDRHVAGAGVDDERPGGPRRALGRRLVPEADLVHALFHRLQR